MSKGVGFRVVTNIERVPLSTVEAFRPFAVANIGDAMGRFAIMDHAIKAIDMSSASLCGTAITVRVRPGDNLMIHKALDMAAPGDVIVVDAQGNTQNGLWGALMTHTAIKKGVAGLVIDGGVRDAAEIRSSGFQVFARAVIAAGGDKDGPGEVNVPVSCGGVPIMPGDLVVGDEDGVVVVPRDDAESVLDRVKAVHANEQVKMEAILNGNLDKSWIDAALTSKGCSFEVVSR